MNRAVFALATALVACGGNAASRAPRRPLPSLASRAVVDSPLRSTVPLTSTKAAWTVPPIVDRRLPNGVRLLVLERHDLPTVVVRFVSDRGTDQAEPGIAQVWARVVLRAGEGHPWYEVNEAFDRLTIFVEPHLDRDSTQLQIRVLSKLFEPAMALVGELMAKPVVNKTALDRAKIAATNAAEEVSDLSIAAHALMYPPGHLYRNVAPKENIAKVSADLVLAYHRAAYTPEHTTVIVAGDVTAEVVEKTVARALTGLDAPKQSSVVPPSVPPVAADKPKFVIVDRPGAPQSNIAALWLGPTIGAADESALRVAAFHLHEELFEDVRVKKGATYGLHVSLPIGRAPRLLRIEGRVETARTVDALQDLIGDVADAGTNPMSADQLAAAHGAAAAIVPGWFDDLPSAASALSLLPVGHLDASFFTTLQQQLQKVGADDVVRAVHTWLPADGVHFVIVGDAKVLQDPIAALGIGTVTVTR